MSEKHITQEKVASSYNAEGASISDQSSSQDVKDKSKGGRPSKYNLDMALVICDRIADGESLVQICKDESMPKKTAVYEWLLRHQEFADMYARAREDQADSLADEIQAIADETPELEPVKDKDGNIIDVRMNSAYVQWQKNRVDARKWIASKLKPKKYSDRITHQGDKEADGIQVDVNIFDEMLKNLELKRQVK